MSNRYYESPNHCFYQTQHQILNQEKVSGPNPLNDDYIGYSDIKIRYR